MKTVLKITLLFLIALCLSSCRTKEKVAERFKETAQTNTSMMEKKTKLSGLQVENKSSGETTHTQWSDNTVERFHERIVTDSNGRVLWQENEHSKDHYTGKARSSTNLSNSIQEAVKSRNMSIAEEQKDSVYNGGVLQEVTVVKSKSWNWLWYVAMLAFLTVLGAILCKIIQRTQTKGNAQDLYGSKNKQMKI